MTLKNSLYPVFIATFLAVIDNLVKYFIRNNNIQEFVVVENFLTIDLTYNTGIAFGFLSDYTNTTYLISLLVLGWLIYQINDIEKNSIEFYSFILILGGALGNLSERGWSLLTGDGGKVTDFIELWFIPSCNIADSVITIGIVSLLLMELKNR